MASLTKLFGNTYLVAQICLNFYGMVRNGWVRYLRYELLRRVLSLYGGENFEVSNEKYPRCLVYIGDDVLPSYDGIIIYHYNDPD